MGSDADHLHHLLLDLVRTAEFTLLDGLLPGRVLSMSQLFAIHELDHRAGMSQRELAERLGLEKSSVSRLVADLEAAGLLTRHRDPDNRRVYRLAITAEGRRLHRDAARVLHERYERWASAMTPSEREGLTVGLPALLRAMRADRLDD
ncbi:MarR family transcriptional regulator [Glycomyces sp. TRM65418]|uniref:MarR family winged helix-turn-helix transcriptional regulator n=1 Tax=Glycomyces sp. TRM65418 TaxID=2867006 RepID=UPI001CE66F8B|nr:MarR family transcriptional regulator [Glycomyces sp. TRM65418]MCC3765618.1 MarR family transcriptional regulator [Glycomyces sp. TRM65418]QZD55217.1 MarR family transcriptional regulator [Glycomyces sp. TRM65418]